MIKIPNTKNIEFDSVYQHFISGFSDFFNSSRDENHKFDYEKLSNTFEIIPIDKAEFYRVAVTVTSKIIEIKRNKHCKEDLFFKAAIEFVDKLLK